MAEGMNIFDWGASGLLIVGGLVHGVQAFGYYPVDMLTTSIPILGKIVYGAVAISAIYAIPRLIMVALD